MRYCCVFMLLLWPCVGSTSDYVIPQAYRSVAEYHNVPAKILYSIALTESQKELSTGVIRPWPWTLNMSGRGQYFNTADDMKAAVYKALNSGIRNIDIGVMQVNVIYHLHRTSYSINDLMRPESNLNVGAEILVDEYMRCDGDWWCAVGSYHSPHDDRAANYIEKVRKWYALVY